MNLINKGIDKKEAIKTVAKKEKFLKKKFIRIAI